MEPLPDLSQLPNVPVMTRERFADLSGVDIGVLNLESSVERA
jgi:hypothetical protein